MTLIKLYGTIEKEGKVALNYTLKEKPMKIELSKWTVEVKEELGWYASEQVKAVFNSGHGYNPDSKDMTLNGQPMLDAKLKLMEVSIISIKEKGENGKDVTFSPAWVEQLTKADGEKLDEALEKIDEKKA